MNVNAVRCKLRKLANKEKAKVLRGFFKNGPGQYGEGDVFLGITVPVLRKRATGDRGAQLADAGLLFRSKIHEERLFALLLFLHAYLSGDDPVKKKIYHLYLKNTRSINNWDLVDLSAPNIVGDYLANKSRRPLYVLAKSHDLWKKRIAILSTFHFIRQNDFSDTFKISRMFIRDNHDLIHKAVGWMLREVGKRDMRSEERFLKQHYRKMPRTMLRYAIERFSEAKRKKYLNGEM